MNFNLPRKSVTSYLLLGLVIALSFPSISYSAFSYSSWFSVGAAGTSGYWIQDATSASATREFSGTSGYGPYSSYASASFDWATGESRFRIDASGFYANASANISIQDRIYPQWVLGTKTDPIVFKVIFDLTGSYTCTVGANSCSTPPNYSGWGLWANFLAAVDYAGPFPFNQYNLSGGGNRHVEFDLTFTPGVSQYVSIYEDIGGFFTPWSGQSASADYSHTATIQIIMPEGATFTSQSQVLLTDDGGGDGNGQVPEPATLALVSLGLLGFGIGRRAR